MKNRPYLVVCPKSQQSGQKSDQYLKVVDGHRGLESFWTDIQEKGDMFTRIEAHAIAIGLRAQGFDVRAVACE